MNAQELKTAVAAMVRERGTSIAQIQAAKLMWDILRAEGQMSGEDDGVLDELRRKRQGKKKAS